MFDGKYTTIFNKNINAKRLYIYFKMHDIIKENLTHIDNQKIANYGLAQFCLLNIIFSVLKSYDETNDLLSTDIDNYFLNKEKYDEFFLDVYNIISNVFNYLIEQLEENIDEVFIYKNFFKNKEKVTSLTTNVKSQFESTLRITRTSYSDYYNRIFVD